MLPGICAYVLYKNGHLPEMKQVDANHLYQVKDDAYSAVLAFLPTGLKGLSVAALTAAIVASLAGKANSISTIFYFRYLSKIY
jgi:SSS family solute:Na+ symporter